MSSNSRQPRSHLILASASPRRRELMALAGLECTVIPPEGEEHMTGDTPADIVQNLSLQKAREVAGRLPKEQLTDVVIGADTVVTLDGTILGKPADPADAARMLKLLSGRTHEVFTGVTILLPAQSDDPADRRAVTFAERTEVTVASLTRDEIDAYVATGEPLDKAGAYGIQGRFAIHIPEIRGDYYNVVGFPVAHLYRELSKEGVIGARQEEN